MPVADSLVDTNILLCAVSDNAAETEKTRIAYTVLQHPDIGFSTQVFGEFSIRRPAVARELSPATGRCASFSGWPGGPCKQ